MAKQALCTQNAMICTAKIAALLLLVVGATGEPTFWPWGVEDVLLARTLCLSGHCSRQLAVTRRATPLPQSRAAASAGI